MSNTILTHAYLREILHYSIITGAFYWLKQTSPKSRMKAGDTAGSRSSCGYRYIEINGKPYSEHRLAWFWVRGEWPAQQVDHKNGLYNANYWLNLREATQSQNMHNRKNLSNNRSGFKGVAWHSRDQKWQDRIMTNTVQKHLGYFETPELAYEARLQAEKELHGEFARAT